MALLFLAILASYIIGSIPTAYIFGKILKGIDIRRCGSGNVGASNVFRIVGRPAGVLVLLADILKGYLAAAVLGSIFYSANVPVSGTTFKLICGAMAIAGHNWTVFLRFKGGKGVATSAGVLLALMPKVVSVCLPAALIIIIATRYVSIASLTVSVLMPALVFAFDYPVELKYFSVTIALVSIYKHKSNIGRLLKREEKRLW